MNPQRALVAFAFLVCCACAGPTLTFCSHPIIFLTAANFQARFATEYYAAAYPAFKWEFRFIGGPDLTVRSFSSAWLQNGSGCDALLGPGFSGLASAISAVVDVPWLDWSATSTELSDKANFPTFSRVAPTDDIGGRLLVQAIAAFGWKQVNIYCVDSAYGRSVAGGVSDAMSATGGMVEVVRCSPASATAATVNAVIDGLLAAQSRLVVLAMSPDDAAYAAFVSSIRSRRLENEFVFLFSEGFCSSSIDSYLQMPGAFCLTYAVDTLLKQPFITAYNARNISQDRRDVEMLGFDMTPSAKPFPIDFYADDIYGSFGHDAVVHMIRTFTSFNESRSDTAAVISHMRSLVSAGITGPVSTNSNGDRTTANGVLYNTVNGAQAAVAYLVNATNLVPTVAGSSQGIFFRGRFVSMSEVPIVNRTPVVASVSSGIISTNMAILIALIVVTLGLVGIFVNKLRHSNRIKQLLAGGGIWRCIRTTLIAGNMVLKIFSAISVSKSDSSSVFIIVYIAITVLTGFVNVYLIFVLMRYFYADVTSPNGLDLDVIIAFDYELAQASIMSLAVQDVPLIVLAFASLLQDPVTVPVLLSLCISCLLAGATFIIVKDRMVRMFMQPSSDVRQFKTLKAVAQHIVVAIRFCGGKFDASVLDTMITGTSTQQEIARFQSKMGINNTDRFRFVRGLTQDIIKQLHLADLTEEEYFGMVRPLMNLRYDMENGGDGVLGISLMMNPLIRPAIPKKNQGRRKPASKQAFFDSMRSEAESTHASDNPLVGDVVGRARKVTMVDVESFE